jgi:D-beta-D-heptose 7-phosphate kinase/D-beta-D-heptose 1-phosphate adenosyltransferase
VKIVTPNGLNKIRQAITRTTFIFTNGCYDILHVGHIRFLQKAKSLGDMLVVGLNSDRSVRMIKGPKRPIIPQDQRAEVLSAIESVDYIIMYDKPTPLELIVRVRPDILVKGEDWEEDKIIGGKEVKEYGGRIERIKFTAKTSTSEIIERIKKDK